MFIKNQTCRNIAALLLFVALMTPTAIQFFHIFEGHEHITCSEKTTHIHTADSDCELCDFNFATYDYSITKYPDLLQPQISSKIGQSLYLCKANTLHKSNTQLRAPPIFS